MEYACRHEARALCPPPLPEEGTAFWVNPKGPGDCYWLQSVASEKLVHSQKPAHHGTESWMSWPGRPIRSKVSDSIQPYAHPDTNVTAAMAAAKVIRFLLCACSLLIHGSSLCIKPLSGFTRANLSLLISTRHR